MLSYYFVLHTSRSRPLKMLKHFWSSISDRCQLIRFWILSTNRFVIHKTFDRLKCWTRTRLTKLISISIFKFLRRFYAIYGPFCESDVRSPYILGHSVNLIYMSHSVNLTLGLFIWSIRLLWAKDSSYIRGLNSACQLEGWGIFYNLNALDI